MALQPCVSINANSSYRIALTNAAGICAGMAYPILSPNEQKYCAIFTINSILDSYWCTVMAKRTQRTYIGNIDPG
jgi:hypothetical protein